MHEDPKYTSKQASDPAVPLVPWTGTSKLGKTVALISLILEQYIFSPSVNIDDGWIPVKKYIEEDLGRPPDGWLPKEKDDNDLRGQPQEGGRLGQRL